MNMQKRGQKHPSTDLVTHKCWATCLGHHAKDVPDAHITWHPPVVGFQGYVPCRHSKTGGRGGETRAGTAEQRRRNLQVLGSSLCSLFSPGPETRRKLLAITLRLDLGPAAYHFQPGPSVLSRIVVLPTPNPTPWCDIGACTLVV